MTPRLNQLLKYKKIHFIQEKDKILIPIFLHKIIMIPTKQKYWISIDFNKNSKVSKKLVKKMFTNFMKIMKRYWIQYVFDENLNFNN